MLFFDCESKILYQKKYSCLLNSKIVVGGYMY